MGILYRSQNGRIRFCVIMFPIHFMTFPPEYFDHYIFDCFFPRSEWKTYKMMIDYEYVDEDEKYGPIICFDQYTYRLWNVTDERTQIKILHVTR